MKIVTAKELSTFLKVSDSTIYNLADQKKLPAFKIGGSWRFDLEEVLKIIKEPKHGALQ